MQHCIWVILRRKWQDGVWEQGSFAQALLTLLHVLLVLREHDRRTPVVLPGLFPPGFPRL
jgi:hypothetical protein